MQVTVELVAAVAGAVVFVLLLVAWRFRSGRRGGAERPVARGPSNMLFVCARCSGQFTHTKRTVAAWEKGSRKVFCDACHRKWRNAQPQLQPQHSNQPASPNAAREYTAPREASRTSFPSYRPRFESRSGCLGIIVFVMVVPVVLFVLASNA